MTVLLIDQARVLLTMDAQRREINNGAIVVRENVIEFVGNSDEARQWLAKSNLSPEREIDVSGCVLTPGLVNCHHHLYQTLTRSIGTALGKSLFDWLQTLYPILFGQT